MDEGKKLPLHDEAKAREEWRGGETLLTPEDGGSLPASESDPARILPDEDAGGRPGRGSPGTIPPPD